MMNNRNLLIKLIVLSILILLTSCKEKNTQVNNESESISEVDSIKNKKIRAGSYSDMCYNKESGDVSGIEVILVYTKKDYYVYFQDSESMPAVPIVIPAKVNGNKIEFIIPSNQGTYFNGKFSGEYKDGNLFAKIDGYTFYADKLILKRQDIYWNRNMAEKYCK